jgi:tetratricopeptide (TPR) repeat protein
MDSQPISIQKKIDSLLKQGATAFQAREWDSAAECYKAILDLAPAQGDSSHFLGLVRAEQGEALEALQLLNQAVQAQPNNRKRSSNPSNKQ